MRIWIRNTATPPVYWSLFDCYLNFFASEFLFQWVFFSRYTKFFPLTISSTTIFNMAIVEPLFAALIKVSYLNLVCSE